MALRAHLKPPLLIIWDGLKAHKSERVRDYLDHINGHIQIAFLSPYAPDLNPVEYLWAWLKPHTLANFCPDNLGELQTTACNIGQRLSPRAGNRQGCGDVKNYANRNNCL